MHDPAPIPSETTASASAENRPLPSRPPVRCRDGLGRTTAQPPLLPAAGARVTNPDASRRTSLIGLFSCIVNLRKSEAAREQSVLLADGPRACKLKTGLTSRVCDRAFYRAAAFLGSALGRSLAGARTKTRALCSWHQLPPSVGAAQKTAGEQVSLTT